MFTRNQQTEMRVAVSVMGELYRGAITTREASRRLDQSAESEARIFAVNPHGVNSPFSASDCLHWSVLVAAAAVGVTLTEKTVRAISLVIGK